MGLFSRRREPREEYHPNLCSTCAMRNSCMEGLKWATHPTHGIIDCPTYEEG